MSLSLLWALVSHAEVPRKMPSDIYQIEPMTLSAHLCFLRHRHALFVELLISPFVLRPRVFCLSVCLCAAFLAWCPRRMDKGVRSTELQPQMPESHHVAAGNLFLAPLQEQHM